MNQIPFEDHVRAGFAAAEETDSLSAKIDQALYADGRKRVQRRRFKLTLAAAATLTIALVAFPTVQAEAQLRRIAGALDNVSSVVIQHYEVDRDGQEHPWGKTSYEGGKWRIDDGRRTTIFKNGTRWILDPAARAYIMERDQEGPAAHNLSSLSLSSMIAQMNQWNPGQKVDIGHSKFNGKDAVRAVILNLQSGPTPQRMTMYADPDTNLPIECQWEVSEKEGFVVKSIIRFEYTAPIPPTTFELDTSFAVLDKKEWEASVVKNLTSKELFSKPIGVHRLVLRNVDVAADGTVYVLYQAGETTPRWERGYAFELTDDLGTKYVKGQVDSRMDEPTIAQSKDGKVELETFVPKQPVKRWEPRTLTLTAFFRKSGSLDRAGKAMSFGNDGNDFAFWIRDPEAKATPLTVLDRRFENPTCPSYPTYAGWIDGQHFGSVASAEVMRATARTWDCLHGNDFQGAERWLEMRLKAIERMTLEGETDWGKASAERSLEYVRRMLGK